MPVKIAASHKRAYGPCVGDIAVVFEEYKRLSRLEEKVVTAMGPPAKQMRYNRKTGEMEIDPTWTDPDEH